MGNVGVTLGVNGNIHLEILTWMHCWALINGVFWFLYVLTSNIVPSMGITAVVTICVVVTLHRRFDSDGKRKLE